MPQHNISARFHGHPQLYTPASSSSFQRPRPPAQLRTTRLHGPDRDRHYFPDENHTLRRPDMTGPRPDVSGLAIIHPPPPPLVSSPPSPGPLNATSPLPPALRSPPRQRHTGDPTDRPVVTKRVTFQDLEHAYDPDPDDHQDALWSHITPPHRYRQTHHARVGVCRPCHRHPNCIAIEACILPRAVPLVNNHAHDEPLNLNLDDDDDDDYILDITDHFSPIAPFPRPPFRPDSPPSSISSSTSSGSRSLSSWSSWGGVWGRQHEEQQHRALDFWCECGACSVQRRLDGLETRRGRGRDGGWEEAW